MTQPYPPWNHHAKVMNALEDMIVALVAAEHALGEADVNDAGDTEGPTVYSLARDRCKAALEKAGIDTKAVWSKYKLGEAP